MQKDARIAKTAVVFPNVDIGPGTEIHEGCIIGFPPRGREPGELPVRIGPNSVIRPHTTIYGGVTIGERFQSGHGAMIREDNRIGNGSSIGTNAVLEPDNVIGDHVRVHSLCFLEWVTLEDYVFLGPGVIFTDDPYPPCPAFKEYGGGAVVRKYAKIGANSTILPKVVVGFNALVGAGAVVTRDVPDHAVVAGAPAKVLKSIQDLEGQCGPYERPYSWPPYDSLK
jgi:acetyltransferase-like isoleucine patch superfamily enzyme